MISNDSVTYTTEINVKPFATYQISDVGLEKGSRNRNVRKLKG